MPALLVLLGPTGVGKTATALQLADALHCPIVNADSRQIYRDIPIGTAAPTTEEMQHARHYFVGMLNLDEYYSAARFEEDVMHLLPTLFEKHETVIMSGGSMLYIDAVCRGLDDIPTVADETRAFVRQLLETHGPEALLQQLSLLDPEYYNEVDRRNTQRVVHALEICLQTGRPFSAFRTHKVKKRPFDIIKIGLNRARPELFDRINRRTMAMMEQGLLEEVKRVMPFRHMPALNTVGYKELFHYLDGEWDLGFALARMQKNTRLYAKKQLTWFKRDADVHWFAPDAQDVILDFARAKGLL